MIRSLDRQDRSKRRDRSISNGRSGSRASTNRDRIRCFNCREYDYFVRECSTRQENREIEQIQQMFNLDDEQTILQTSLMDTDDDEMTVTLTETRDSLNLQRVEVVSLHFYLLVKIQVEITKINLCEETV